MTREKENLLSYWIWDSIQNASLKSMKKKKLYSLMANNYKELKEVLSGDEIEELKESIVQVREMDENQIEIEVQRAINFYSEK